MPIYEYRCEACHRRTTVLTLRASATLQPTCEHCGAAALTRLLSRPARVRSADSRFDAVADPSQVDPTDPAAVGRWVRRLGTELGEETGDDFEQVCDEIERGEDEGPGDDGERA